MTVVYQSATELQRSASAATTTFAHSAGPGVSGVLVGFVKGGAAVTFSAVSYGGTTLVQYGKAQDTATELGSAEWWFAPHTTSGSQNVAYNAGAVASNVHVVAITIAAAGTPWVQGQQIKQENTTSHSVSLTTGYVSGMAFGAFYGGAAAPASLSYATDRVLVHDWDFGAFYSEFFRQASATSPGVANPMGFGGDCPTSDDLAFAAVYITDGGIAAGVGHVDLVGLAPALLGERVITPSQGLVTFDGVLPTVSGSSGTTVLLIPGVGLVDGSGILLIPGGGLVEPVAPAAAEGATVLPITGLITVQGHQVSLWLERKIESTVGLASLEGRGPAVLGENELSPVLGSFIIQGLAPSTYLERIITPDSGLVATEGRVPGLQKTFPAGETVLEPLNGLVSFSGNGSLAGLRPRFPWMSGFDHPRGS